MTLAPTELLLTVLVCAWFGLTVRLVLRAQDRAKDRPALVGLLAWARSEGLELTRIRKCRGDVGRRG